MLAATQYIRTLLVWTAESVFMRYGFAALAVTLATLLRLGLNPFLLNTVPYITYFLAITVTGWIGGGGAAVFALVLSAIAAGTLFLPPLYIFSISGTPDLVAFAVFLAMGG